MTQKEQDLKDIEKSLASMRDEHRVAEQKLSDQICELRAELNYEYYKVRPGSIIEYKGEQFLVHYVSDEFRRPDSYRPHPHLQVRRKVKNGWHKTPTHLYEWGDDKWSVVGEETSQEKLKL